MVVRPGGRIVVTVLRKEYVMSRYKLLLCALVLCGVLIVSFNRLSNARDYYMASSFLRTVNELCAVTVFNVDLGMTAIFSDNSEFVQAAFKFLLDTYKNDEEVLEKLLDFRDYITDRDWIDRYIWADFDNTKIHFLDAEERRKRSNKLVKQAAERRESTDELVKQAAERRERMVELRKQADALIRELNPRAGL